MCDPTVMMIASTTASLIGQQQQANITEANMRRQAEIYDYNAKVAANDALMAKWSSEAEADTFDRRLAVLQGKQGPKFAKSGVVINRDTPLKIAADTAAEGMLERLNIINKGTLEADRALARMTGQRIAAEQKRFSAGTVQTAARIQQAATVGKAGYTLLGE